MGGKLSYIVQKIRFKTDKEKLTKPDISSIYDCSAIDIDGNLVMTDADLKEYIDTKFKRQFPLFQKVICNGLDCHPLFHYLRYNSSLHNPKTGKTKQLPWNFSKFLIDGQTGKVLNMFGPQIAPSEMQEAIKNALSKK